MRPIVKYRGGKARELPKILRNLPAYRGRDVEPFVGRAALFFHLEPGQAIVNDINAKLANPKARIPNANESLYYRLRDMYNGLTPAEYSPALLYYFINKTAYSGMIRHNARGEYNVPYGRYRHFRSDGVTLAHSQLLQRAEVLQGDYRQVFDLLETEDFVFLDPPYGCQFTDYGNTEYRDGFGESEQIRLAEDFRNLPCRAMPLPWAYRRRVRQELRGEHSKSFPSRGDTHGGDQLCASTSPPLYNITMAQLRGKMLFLTTSPRSPEKMVAEIALLAKHFLPFE